MIEKQLEEKPEEVVMWSLSSLEMCKRCPGGSDVHIKEPEKVRECICRCVCVLIALPVRKNINQCYNVTVLQELLHTKIQLCITFFSFAGKN